MLFGIACPSPMMNQPQSAAVIDLGTNSIKFILAEKTSELDLKVLEEQTLEVRIGEGISHHPPRIRPDAIEASVQAIAEILSAHLPNPEIAVRVVATSAMREAENSHQITEALKAKTGIKLEILDGQREAYYIGQAIRMEARYAQMDRLYAMDLGGGSLEWIHIQEDTIQNARSLPLGAVRLTERWVEDPTKALPDSAISAVRKAVRASLIEAELHVPTQSTFLGSGGVFYILKALSGGDSQFKTQEIEALAQSLAQVDISQRIEHFCVPEKRADILPVALITIASVLQYFQIKTIEHSKSTLKYGLLKELLRL